MGAMGLHSLGIATAIGAGKVDVAAAIGRGEASGLSRRPDLYPGIDTLVGAIDGTFPAPDSSLQAFDSRNNRLALLVLKQLETELILLVRKYGPKRIGVIMGTSTSGIGDAETALEHRLARGAWPENFRYSQQELGNVAEFVARVIGVTGPAFTVATACSSSGKAIASGRRLIETGVIDAAVVGGCDTLCRMTLRGFQSLDSLTSRRCNPFSANRDGIAIGEAAAIFLMSSEAGSVNLLGVGESSDAYHANAPHPQGTGAISAMESALRDAHIDAGEIDYVNLHGTATPLNDLVESHAVHTIFGTSVPCSSTKAMTGHTLGAASACEAAILWLTLHPEFSSGRLPPHLWDGICDPELAPILLASQDVMFDPKNPASMLSSSFGFGGSNVALVLGHSGS
jgi:3-oxoacyl-[acyl-carrier-protein] synthase-1